MRIAFGELPIGARFIDAAFYRASELTPPICTKVSQRKYQVAAGQIYRKSAGVYVVCVEDELRLAVLRAREARQP